MEKCCRIEEMIRKSDIETDLIAEDNPGDIHGHITECKDCSDLIRQMNAVVEKIRSIPRVRVSDTFNDNLMETIRASRPSHADKAAERKISFAARSLYYVSGIAAVVLAFIYVSSLGIFENNSNIENGLSIPAMSVAAEENVPAKSITDSLENLGRNVKEDESLRLKVSTGE